MKRSVVLCGPGNNGGDGFVVARLLKARGWAVEVFLYGAPEKLPPDAKVNYERWCEMGEVQNTQVLSGWTGRCSDLVVDALFGTGLTRQLDSEACDLTKFLVSHPLGKTVSVDAISGVEMDSGRELVENGNAFFCSSDLVVSFHKEKVGHRLGERTLDVEKVRVVDIGLAEFADPTDQVELIELDDWETGLSKGDVWRGQTNKYTHGHALILSGPPGHTGAARLAARGALRIGAGLVTLGVPPEAQVEVASQITAIMMRQVGEVRAFEALLEDERLNALCIGPGFGFGDESRGLIEAGLKSRRAIVLDADALTLIGREATLFAGLHENCVLTPHAGEFARLFPDIAEKLNAPATKGPAYSKVDATREAAARAGCVVLFKGPDTVIAAPDGRCSINSAHYDRAAPWLATAGSGDVLAGFITGLLARGFPPMQAAETAAWLHVECALSFGPGLIAEDIPEELPKVFRSLGMA